MAGWVLVVVALLSMTAITALPDGAPQDACYNMTPNHGPILPSSLPRPFTITVSPEKFSVADDVKVTIRMNEGRKMKGFMILARRVDCNYMDQNLRIGTFKDNVDRTKHVCDRSGLTHTREFRDNPQSLLTVHWTPPSTPKIAVQFRVTVVEEREKFWVDELSDIIYHHQLTPPATKPTTSQPDVLPLDMTEGCGQTKGCYRNPPQCSEDTCDIVVTWKRLRDRRYKFEMSADTDGWVAFGLSDDKFMGDDDVMECLWNPANSRGEARISKNDGKDNKPQPGVCVNVTASKSQPVACADVHGGNQNSPQRDGDNVRQSLELSRCAVDHPEGRIRCWFIRDFPSGSLSKSESHYLLMAKGRVDDDGVKLRHSLEPNKYPYVSPSMVNLKYNEDITDTARYPLVKAHGILMLIAWMMCASTALLLAKYYKRMWPNDSLCGVEVWFAVHRALMIVCLILTAIAFILIFVHVGGYSHMPDYADKAHPPLGICVMILVVLNPLISLFRCKPSSKYRPIFNWFHWLFGTVAYVLQLPAVFIGLNLHKAFVPSWATWVITAFVLFHLIIELLLEIHGCLNARKQKRRDDDFERTKKTDFKGDYQGVKEEPVGHRFKKIVLSIYLVVVIVLGVLMVLAVAVG